MTWKLFCQAIAKFILGFVLLSVLIFVPAGTWLFPGGLLFLGLLFLPMVFVGAFLMVKNPALLEKRMEAKEKEADQKLVVLLSGLMFLFGFVLAGLDFRFGWFPLPGWVKMIAAAVFLFSYLIYAEVLRENTYLSRTVKVEKNQKVIDTGLYGLVRHPMYLSTVFLFLSIPLILGSATAFPVFLLYPFLLVKRIKKEEAILEKELEGYTAYKEKVKYRLIPFVW